MRCEEVQDQLSAYLEHDLEPVARRNIEAHVEECIRCRQELTLLRQTVSALQSLEEIEVPPRLTAAIQTGVSDREHSSWRRIASRLFFPMHIKLPLEAMALLLIALGVVYLYRTTPELAQAPRPQAVTERESRAKTAPGAAGTRGDRQEHAARQRSAEKFGLSSAAQKKPEAQEESDAIARAPQEEVPAVALRDISAAPEMTLKTGNPLEAASRITTLVESFGGKVLEKKEEDHLILAIPASSYPKFLAALRELGEPAQLPAEPSSPPVPHGTVTFSLRLVR